MRIVDIMSEDLIIPELAGTTREAVLAELVDCIVSFVPEIDAEHAIHVLVERERMGSTGVGQGLAIPHAKLPHLRRAVACFARSRRGVEFGALDGQPTHLFLALLAPEGNAGFHLKALARASRMFKDAAFRAALLEAPDAALWAAIQDKDEALTQLGG
jgi:PTS system nitrogen regulatory IIA component